MVESNYWELGFSCLVFGVTTKIASMIALLVENIVVVICVHLRGCWVVMALGCNFVIRMN